MAWSKWTTGATLCVWVAVTVALVAPVHAQSVTVGFAQSAYSVFEGNGTVSVCVSLLGDATPFGLVTVNVATEDIPGSATSGFDYSSTSLDLTFDPVLSINNEQLQCTDIPIFDDGEQESTERFLARLTLRIIDTPITVDMDTTTVSILDNDAVTVSFEQAAYTVMEEAGVVTVCATVTGTIERNVSVFLEATDVGGGATDFSAPSPNELVFQPSAGNTLCTNISITDDSVVEGSETFNVSQFTEEPGVIIGAPSIAGVEIVDNDVVAISMLQSEYVADEDAESVTVCATIPIAQIERAVTFMLSTSDITATEDVDYIPATAELTFLPGSGDVLCIDVLLMDDSLLEANETFDVLLTTNDPAVIFAGAGATVTIVDDELFARIGFEQESYTVFEENGVLELCVAVIEGDINSIVRVAIRYFTESGPGSADFSSDILPTPEFVFELTSSVRRECTFVTITSDFVIETQETFRAELMLASQPSSTTVILDPREANITIFDGSRECNPSTEFYCRREDLCLPLGFICDGIPDCIDGGDERSDTCLAFGVTAACTEGNVRLVEEVFFRVEMCVDGLYRTVCSEGWDLSETGVVCRQMGVDPVGIAVVSFISPGDDVRLEVQCQGSESSLLNCSHLINDQFCPVVGVECLVPEMPLCEDADLRLVGGENEMEGRVEMCYRGIWWAILDSDWRYNDAATVCRQLGFGNLDAVPIWPVIPQFGEPPAALFNREPVCSPGGTENRLLDCSTSDFSQPIGSVFAGLPSNVVGVRCEELPLTGCTEGEVRLVRRERIESIGDVQICFGNSWSNLCVSSRYWDNPDASVVCSQLGFEAQGSIAIQQTFRPLPQNIVTLSPQCNGTESDLFECESVPPLDRRGLQDDVCFLAAVECPVPPRILLTPRSDGNYTLDIGRSASVSCGVDTLSSRIRQLGNGDGDEEGDRRLRRADGVGDGIFFSSGANVVVFRVNDTATEPVIIPPCPVATVIETQAISLEDAGQYRCVAENPIGRSRMDITINVLGPQGTGSSATLLLSQVELSRIFSVEANPELLDRERVLELLTVPMILAAISEDTPGVQTVECSFVERRPIDIERRLDRVECVVTTFPAVNDTVVIVEEAVAFLREATSFFTLFDVPASGICNAESMDTIFGSYSWPETTGGDTVALPCVLGSVSMDDSVALATRMCGEGGVWMDPDYSQCVDSICNAEFMDTIFGSYSWPDTTGGDTVALPCVLGSVSMDDSVALATRMCGEGGVWMDPNYSQCADTFDVLESMTITADNYEQIISELRDSVENAEPADQNEDNIAAISSVMEDTAVLVAIMGEVSEDLSVENPMVPVQTVIEILEIKDILQEWNVTVVSANIVESSESIFSSYALQESFTNLVVEGENLVFVVERLDVQTLIEFGRGFSVAEDPENGILNANTGGGAGNFTELAPDELVIVFLPPSLFALFESTDDVSLFFAMYRTAVLFPLGGEAQVVGPDGADRMIGSPVVAATVAGQDELRDLPDPVSILLRLNSLDTAGNITAITCVSYDFDAADGRGNWTSEGCVTEVIDDGDGVLDDEDIVSCSCNHLTNYAALVDVCSRTGGCAISSEAQLALDVISIVGVVLSLLGIIITIFTLLVFKKLRQRDPTKYHIQLCIALFCMLLVFVIGIDQNKVSEGCVAVSVLIHYFTLVAVMWMGAEATLMFQKLVIIFVRITTRYIIIVSLVCWLVPIIPAVIPAALDWEDVVSFTDSGDIDFCFIGNTAVFFGAFLGPILAVVAFNFVIFCIVVSVLIRHAMRTAPQVKGEKKIAVETTVRLLINITGVMFLFGLTWVFGALTVAEASLTFQILFAIFNSFQGFFIFLFFVVFSKDAREAWKEVLSCGQYTSTTLHPSHAKNTSSTPVLKSKSTTAASKITTRTGGASKLPQFEAPSGYDRFAELASLEPVSTTTFGKSSTEKDTNVDRVDGVKKNPGFELEKGESLEEEALQQTGEAPGLQVGRETTGLKARVQRYSTKYVGKHHVESYEVDFVIENDDETGFPNAPPA